MKIPRITILIELGPEKGKVGHQYWSTEISYALSPAERQVVMAAATNEMLRQVEPFMEEIDESDSLRRP